MLLAVVIFAPQITPISIMPKTAASCHDSPHEEEGVTDNINNNNRRLRHRPNTQGDKKMTKGGDDSHFGSIGADSHRTRRSSCNDSKGVVDYNEENHDAAFNKEVIFTPTDDEKSDIGNDVQQLRLLKDSEEDEDDSAGVTDDVSESGEEGSDVKSDDDSEDSCLEIDTEESEEEDGDDDSWQGYDEDDSSSDEENKINKKKGRSKAKGRKKKSKSRSKRNGNGHLRSKNSKRAKGKAKKKKAVCNFVLSVSFSF